MPAHVHVSQHPLVRHKQTTLRHSATDPAAFRVLVRQLAQLLFFEATADLTLENHTVPTPLATYPGQRVTEKVGLLPILRAGLGMAEAVLDLLPTAQVWHLGLYRDHDTCQPITYYNKMPPGAAVDVSLVVDPMLATGGSAVAALDILKKLGARRIKYLAMVRYWIEYSSRFQRMLSEVGRAFCTRFRTATSESPIADSCRFEL